MSHSSARLEAPSRKYAVALVEAGFCQCRFIISEDEPRAICCGAPTSGGSWCDWHRSIVYEAARERSPKPRDRHLAYRAA
jgi:hypothetical protein